MTILCSAEGACGMNAAREALLKGGPALDAVEAGIRKVEANTGIRSVGLGGAPNLLGKVECDAAIMDGSNLMAGSVGALKSYLHAISVARTVMERLPHVMLVGDGARRFAQEIGAEKAAMLTPEARSEYKKWLRQHVPASVRNNLNQAPLTPYVWESAKGYGAGGTVVFLVRDDKGNLAAGTSTAGWAESYPGRLGDSPIIGAGLYADNRLGACGCTHVGEMTMRAVTARSVLVYLKKGASLPEACQEAMAELKDLRGGQIGSVMIHALDIYGNPHVIADQDLGKGLAWHLWTDETAEPVEHRSCVFAPR